MTLSLLHFNPTTGLAASLSATGGVAVGGYVNHSWRGLGCCATQGLYTNPWYPEKTKQALELSQKAETIISSLKQYDADYLQRQCLIIDANGNSAALNGSHNIPICHSLHYRHVAVAGNMLANKQVLNVLSRSFIQSICINADAVLNENIAPIYHQNYETTLSHALINALELALLEGGDKRGARSASLRIESMSAAPIDIRVDWADSDLANEMKNVLKHVEDVEFQSFLSKLPKD